ncbi:DNA polymerase IV [bacterium]|nr:DNA polymerase IV [bacterium]
MIQRIIMHVDMDAFFASVEQRDQPELKGQPVVVGGSPEERGVVAAASYEARPFGIRSAMPMSQALRLCPHAVLCKPRFEAYRQASEIVQGIFRNVTQQIEPVSLDEAYLDVTRQTLDFDHAKAVAKRIRADIQDQTQLTASVGIGPNKFLAKVASDFDKPDGLFVILPEEVDPFLEPLPVRVIPGVGKRTEERLTELDIETVADLKQKPLGELQGLVGNKHGERLYYLARGMDFSSVMTERRRKSLSSERTFYRDISEKKEMKFILRELAQEVGEHLEKASLRGKTVGIKVRLDNFQIYTRALTLDHYTCDAKQIGTVACHLLGKLAFHHRKVRLLGVRVSGFLSDNGHGRSPHHPVQMTFWD